MFFVNPNLFCDCCGMRLRGGPSARGLRTPITNTHILSFVESHAVFKV